MYYPFAKFGDDMSTDVCARVHTCTHAHIHVQVQSRAADRPTHAFDHVGVSEDMLTVQSL